MRGRGGAGLAGAGDDGGVRMSFKPGPAVDEALRKIAAMGKSEKEREAEKNAG